MGEIAVRVDDVAKRFRLMHERNATLKATLMRGGRRTTYEEFWAVDGVSFDVPAGSMFGMIGHNGSGKSTLLKCMAGILRPDRGSITVNGKMSALLELGAGFHPELTGRENVFLNGSILGLSTREVKDRFDDIVAFSGLERFIDQPVKNYSSGMFVRLGFSVAINVEPEVLLVDEVMAVGDEQFQQRCNEKFAALRAQGRTIVVVSHGLESLRHQCDSIAWMAEGGLQQVGPAGEVIDAYLESVRAADVGSATAVEAGAGVEIALLDASGEPTLVADTGGTVTFRSRFASPAEPDDLSLALDVYRPDGVHLVHTEVDITTTTTGGTDVADYSVDRLPLVPGVYDVSVGVASKRLGRTIARTDRGLRFEVRHSDDADRAGMVALGGRWALDTVSEEDSM